MTHGALMATAIALSLGLSGVAHANLVTNGGFETERAFEKVLTLTQCD